MSFRPTIKIENTNMVDYIQQQKSIQSPNMYGRPSPPPIYMNTPSPPLVQYYNSYFDAGYAIALPYGASIDNRPYVRPIIPAQTVVKSSHMNGLSQIMSKIALATGLLIKPSEYLPLDQCKPDTGYSEWITQSFISQLCLYVHSNGKFNQFAVKSCNRRVCTACDCTWAAQAIRTTIAVPASTYMSYKNRRKINVSLVDTTRTHCLKCGTEQKTYTEQVIQGNCPEFIIVSKDAKMSSVFNDDENGPVVNNVIRFCDSSYYRIVLCIYFDVKTGFESSDALIRDKTPFLVILRQIY